MDKLKRLSASFILFSFGFISLLFQTIIIREFAISFGGNELGIAVFYFFWFFWVGAGAIAALFVSEDFLSSNFLGIVSIYPIAAILEFILFLNLRLICSVKSWEFFTYGRGILPVFIFTGLISFFTGIIFSSAALWLKRHNQTSSGVIAFIYILESLGSFLAGVLVTLLFINLVEPLAIILGVCLFFYITGMVVCFFLKDIKSLIINAVLFLVFLFICLNYNSVKNIFFNQRARNLLPKAQLIYEVYSPNQQLIAFKQAGQTALFSNGSILTSIPEYANANSETALLLAQTNLARDILVIGLGAENTMASLFKFPVRNVTYCLQDKVYYDRVLKNNPYLTDKRLNIVLEEPRLFLKNNKYKFDLALIYAPDPVNLFLNSFFTQEFYALVRDNLKNNGVIALKIRSAEDFAGSIRKDYGASIYYTLKTIFPNIVIIPGEFSWFFASQGNGLTQDAYELAERLSKFTLHDFSFKPNNFYSIVPKDRVEFTKQLYIENDLFKNNNIINSDTKPLAFFFNLLILASYTQPVFANWFRSIFFTPFYVVIIPILIFYVLRVIFLRALNNTVSKREVFNAKLFQFTSAFLGFSFNLILIFIFQNKFGNIFQMIGFISAIFMFGLVLGGVISDRFIKKGYDSLRLSIGAAALGLFFLILAYFIFIVGGSSNQIVFFISFLIAGILGGLSYPLCTGLMQERVSLKFNAVYLEMLDHWGAGLAALFTGFIFLPVWGVRNCFILLILINFGLLLSFMFEYFKFFKKEKLFTGKYLNYIKFLYIFFGIALTILGLSSAFNFKNRITENSKAGCLYQSAPFKAYICNDGNRVFYRFNSKDYAGRIKGFGGPIDLDVNLTDKGEIQEIKIIKHNESIFYVKNLSGFLDKFKGRSIKEEFSLKNIDTITGATITSQAIIDIVNELAKQVRNKPQYSVKPTFKKSVFNFNQFLFIFFPIAAFFLYIRGSSSLVRKTFLIFIVILLGIVLNVSFSTFHLENIFKFKFFNLEALQLTIIVVAILSGILFGQFWCGWLCPFGALQEIINLKPKQVSYDLDKKARLFKYFLLCVFIISAAFNSSYLFKQEPLLIFFARPWFSLEKILGTVVLIFSIFFLRFWCRYFCICGAFLSFFNKIAILKKLIIKRYNKCPLNVKGQNDIDCIECNICQKRD